MLWNKRETGTATVIIKKISRDLNCRLLVLRGQINRTGIFTGFTKEKRHWMT